MTDSPPPRPVAVAWTGTLPWAVPVAIAGLGLSSDSPAWRAAAAAGMLLAAAAAAVWQVFGRYRRDRELAELAEHLRRGTSSPLPLLPPHEPEPDLRDAVRSVARRARRTDATVVELAEDRDRLFAALEGMSEGVLAVDGAERLLLVNRSATALLRLPLGELKGRRVWEVVRRSAVTDACEAVLGGAGRYEAEFEVGSATLALRADPLPGIASAKGAAGAVLQVRDVTDLRRLESMRRDFVSNVSHELKTPIAAISALAETLLDGPLEGPPIARRFLKDIENHADRLHDLVVDVIRLARVESGRDVFDVRRVPVGPAVEEALRGLRAAAVKAGVQLSSVPPPEAAHVRADADALITILDNLLTNALRHTPAGGRATVEWFPDQVDDRPVIRLRVIDTGEGIPPEHLNRVFQRFHRVDPARSREKGGTGLGLAIVKQMVAVFDGAVAVESEPGRGATFTVTLPAA
ncbi:sensor histidine kinase [Alienimonas californiensis]|uniref:histidine kinase n=1 Tax=Alienimonas californiensis TaxID=2527989 RepID=A0A517PBR2_9PLAN|nr:ATP-binding protein [Alienimonas californiensis]QDT16801.1 Alkaline phosphatase synthesis sensor protein PhoR [Alienimonas californiensis]